MNKSIGLRTSTLHGVICGTCRTSIANLNLWMYWTEFVSISEVLWDKDYVFHLCTTSTDKVLRSCLINACARKKSVRVFIELKLTTLVTFADV